MQSALLQEYLSTPAIQVAVVTPGLITLGWLARAAWRRDIDPTLVWAWMACLFISYFSSRWHVDGDLHELYIIPAFLLFTAAWLYCGRAISPAAAFALTFLADWTIDMKRGYELALTGAFPVSSFYHGVGGAGAGDGLFFFPLVAAFLVVYVKCRQSPASWGR